MNLKLLVISCLIFSSFTSLALAGYAARKLRTSGSIHYMVLMLCVLCYSFGYAIELSNKTLEGIYLGLRIEYLGIPWIPIFWFVMAHKYTGMERPISRQTYIVLSIIPIVTFVLVQTNSYHHLYYKEIDIVPFGPFHLAIVKRGIWYFVHQIYNNLLIITGNTMFFILIIRTSGFHRKQAIATFLASMIPWIGNIIYQLDIMSYPLDYTPLFFALTGPIFAISLFRFRMFDLIPIARSIVFEKMHDPVIVLDSHHRVADLNQVAKEIFHSRHKEFLGAPINDLLAGYEDLLKQIDGEAEEKIEIEIIASDGKKHYNSRVISIHSVFNKNVGKVLTLHDVTSEKKLIEKLESMATTDYLTGVYNRRKFLELCHQELKRAQRNGRGFSIMMIDLDHFKQVNDTFGHQAGDLVLKEVVRCFRQNLRASDILGRYGGEEFVVLLPETERAGSLIIAERICRGIAARGIYCGDRCISVTASIGLSTYDGCLAAEDAEKIISQADNAMYEAKKRGRDRVVEFSSLTAANVGNKP